jgi:hypothetical protein
MPTISHSNPFIARQVRALMTASPDIDDIQILVGVWAMQGLKLTDAQIKKLRDVSPYSTISRAISRERARRAKLNGLG